MDTVQARYESILDRINRSALSVGRNPDSIRLIVVTKLQPVDVIWEVITAGARHLGENYIEEAIPKIISFRSQSSAAQEVTPHEITSEAHPIDSGGIQWHIIGHVQSRKARLVSEWFQYLHSLDSVKLAGRLNHACSEQKRVLPVLLEMNVSGEQTKFGFPAWEEARWDNLLPDIYIIAALPSLRISGLMTMAPFFDKPEDARPYYQRIRRLQEYLFHQVPEQNWHELSMGMSGDFEVAIQEGATWVRIGQAILGPRPE